MRPDLDLLLFTDKSKAFFASGLREGSAESSERARMELNNWKVTDRTRGRRLHACLLASLSLAVFSPAGAFVSLPFLRPPSSLRDAILLLSYPSFVIFSHVHTTECNALGTNERLS